MKLQADEIIAFPTSEGYTMTPLQAIIYLKSDGNYTSVFLENKEQIYLTRQLKDLELFLLHSLFLRVHRVFGK